MTPQDERRAHPRASLRLEAAYEDEDRQIFLSARDLSEGGVYLEARDPPLRGQRARITLELPGRPQILRLTGAVVRRDPERGFALSFDPEAVPHAIREQLRDFVATGDR